MTQRRVLIGTPAYTWSVDVRYAHSLGLTIKLCIEQGIDLRWVFTPGDAIVQSACNDLIAIARESNFDDLIIIGSDQDWEAEWIVRLLSYPVDVVGGAVRKKTDDRELYNVKVLSGIHSFVRHPTHDIITAPDMALGTGFLRLSRKAMDALWDASEKYTIVGRAKPSAWVFDIRPVNGQLVGEDIHMCHMLRSLGFEVWLDPTMCCGHIGQKRFAGDFGAWLARAQAEAAA
jgi:hypothetical protein